MRKQVEGLLFEAFRRNEMADETERSKPPCRRWLGLGTEAAYRPGIKAGLFVFHDGKVPPPRCMGWLCLTAAGLGAMEEREGKFRDEIETMKRCGYEDTICADYSLAGGLAR